MYKKGFLLIAILVFTCQTGYSQKNVQQIFTEFSKERQVRKITLGKVIMGFVGMFTETMGVNQVQILSFEECGEEVKENFSHAIKNLKDSEYETMISTNEGNQRTKVMVKIKEETIREMVIVTTGNGTAMVRLKGNIKPSDIERLVKEHGNG